MTYSDNLYIRRHGNMLFWRVGRIGGSMYLARSATPRTAEKQELKAARRARLQALRQEARMSRYWYSRWSEQSRIAVGRA